MEARAHKDASMSRVMLLFWLVSVGTLGCRTVSRPEIAGTWVIVDKSLLPATQQSAASTLVLDPSGTFVATEVPGATYYAPPEVKDRVFSATGTWKLEKYEGRQEVRLVIQSITSGPSARLPYSSGLGISTGWSSVVLYYFQGDPDEGRRVDFEKQTGQTKAAGAQ